MVFKGKKETSEIKDCLEIFQQTVNWAAGNQHLKFTADIWTDGANPPTPEKEDQVQIVAKRRISLLGYEDKLVPGGGHAIQILQK